MKEVVIGIIQDISDSCGVREEGCRAMAKWQGCLEWISCISVVIQVVTTKSEWSAPAF